MYTTLLHTHSLLRYAILILPVVIVVKLLLNHSKVLKKIDKQLLLGLMIVAHTQLLMGTLLFFVSPSVQFSSSTMKDANLRYWSVEHGFLMLIVIVLFTLARVYSKKSISDNIKYRRVLILMATGLGMALISIAMSGRGILIPTAS